MPLNNNTKNKQITWIQKVKNFLPEPKKKFFDHFHWADWAFLGVIILLLIYIILANFLPSSLFLIVCQGAVEGGFVGAFCDWIAIRSLFQRIPFVPKSGVIENQREALMQGIVNTVRNDWANPDAISEEMNKLDIKSELLKAVESIEDQYPLENIITERIVDITEKLSLNMPDYLNKIVERLGLWIASHEFYEFLLSKIKEQINISMISRAAEIAGVIDREVITRNIQIQIVEFLTHWSQRPDALKPVTQKIVTIDAQQLSETLLEQLHNLIDKMTSSEEKAIRQMITNYSPILSDKIGSIVFNQLNQLSKNEINRYFKEKTQDQLNWIRFNGAILGTIIGAILSLLLHLLT
ncbi:MAG: DUF445 family protein [Desulfobacterales bacterium]|nr:DUF445 family protein [Desulfobacterales bacterium]